MRRTVLALLTATALAAALAACQPPADKAAEPGAAATAATPAPEMPADAPPQEEVDPTAAQGDAIAPAEASSTSCNLDQGADAAQRLVDRCIAVSPATHPPCDAQNPCQMIQDEIDRACAMYGPGETRPAECSA